MFGRLDILTAFSAHSGLTDINLHGHTEFCNMVFIRKSLLNSVEFEMQKTKTLQKY